MLFILSAFITALLCNSFQHELSATLGRWNIPLLSFTIKQKTNIMKNLKKVSRAGMKTIKGGVFVTCMLPNGEPTRCTDRCPQDFCGPTSYMCLIPMDLCGEVM